MNTSIIRVKNASEQALDIVQREFRDYHPLVSLARLAHRDDVTCDPKLELEVHKAILPYVTPKLSSVEVKTDNSEARRVVVSLFEPQQLENGSVVDAEIHVAADFCEIIPLDS